MYKIKIMRSKIIKLALSANAYFMCNIRVVYCTWHGGEWDSSKSKSSYGSTGNLRCPDQVSRTSTHIYWDQVLLFDSCSHKLYYYPLLCPSKELHKKNQLRTEVGSEEDDPRRTGLRNFQSLMNKGTRSACFLQELQSRAPAPCRKLGSFLLSKDLLYG